MAMRTPLQLARLPQSFARFPLYRAFASSCRHSDRAGMPSSFLTPLGNLVMYHKRCSLLMHERQRRRCGASLMHLTSRFFSATVPDEKDDKVQVIVVTSGKGGVGKTTSAAALAAGLAMRGFRTVGIDFDVGLRNLDIHLGMERRIIYDFINVINGECSLRQALVKDKRLPNLYLLAASQTRDKTALKEEGVEKVINELKKEFDYIICDSPAGIESGAYQAMLFADYAVICSNPELSSVRDSDKMVGFISSKSLRALQDRPPVQQSLLVTRYNPDRVENGEMLPLDDITDMLGLPLVGVIPDTTDILNSINVGKPVTLSKGKAADAYQDTVARFLGEEREFRYVKREETSFFGRIFGRK